jgi:menaquinone-dependent protoporphyrinogen oxidase
MKQTILVAYATKRGSTQEVATGVAATLRSRGLEVELRPAGDVESLARYGGVVLGGAHYMGRVHQDARAFLRRHRRELASLPVAVFAMGPKTLAEDDVAGSRAQLDRELAKVAELEPVSVAIFGGVVDPAQLRFPFNHMVATDARDWPAIRGWAVELARLLGTPDPAVPAHA